MTISKVEGIKQKETSTTAPMNAVLLNKVALTSCAQWPLFGLREQTATCNKEHIFTSQFLFESLVWALRANQSAPSLDFNALKKVSFYEYSTSKQIQRISAWIKHSIQITFRLVNWEGRVCLRWLCPDQ